MAIHSDMQGPCPTGFHVPTNTEWQNVYTIWTTLWWSSSGAVALGAALKLPFAGCRQGSSGSVVQSDFSWNFWSCTYRNDDKSYYLYIDSEWMITPQSYSYWASYGYSIRPFRDSPVTPTANWAKLYGTSIAAGWIFWDSLSWLISLSGDWTTWITMMDKNLWATTVRNSWDTLSEANCGKFYQRWNNYWFPRTWTLSDITTTRVNASTYWPGNYYSSSTFIKRASSPYRWDSSNNQNLRWWVSQGAWRDPLTHWEIGTWHMEYVNDDYSAMQWPAPAWFHVPLTTEWKAVYDIRKALGWWSSDWTNFWITLKLPFAGNRNRTDSNVSLRGSSGLYWSSSRYTTNYAYDLNFSYNGFVNPSNSSNRAYGQSVRCLQVIDEVAEL